MILKGNGEIDVKSIMNNNGFHDITPDTGLFAQKIFQKGKKRIQFVGWCNEKPNGLWYDIEVKKV